MSAPAGDLQAVLERADDRDWVLRITTADSGSAVGRVSRLSSAAVTLGDRPLDLVDLSLIERERDRSAPLLIGIVAGTLSGLAGGHLYSAVTETSTSPGVLVGSALIGLGIGAIVARQSNREWETVWPALTDPGAGTHRRDHPPSGR